MAVNGFIRRILVSIALLLAISSATSWIVSYRSAPFGSRLDRFLGDAALLQVLKFQQAVEKDSVRGYWSNIPISNGKRVLFGATSGRAFVAYVRLATRSLSVADGFKLAGWWRLGIFQYNPDEWCGGDIDIEAWSSQPEVERKLSRLWDKSCEAYILEARAPIWLLFILSLVLLGLLYLPQHTHRRSSAP